MAITITAAEGRLILANAIAKGEAHVADLEPRHAESFAGWQKTRNKVPYEERRRIDRLKDAAVEKLQQLRATVAKARAMAEKLAGLPDETPVEVDGEGNVTVKVS